MHNNHNDAVSRQYRVVVEADRNTSIDNSVFDTESGWWQGINYCVLKHAGRGVQAGRTVLVSHRWCG